MLLLIDRSWRIMYNKILEKQIIQTLLQKQILKNLLTTFFHNLWIFFLCIIKYRWPLRKNSPIVTHHCFFKYFSCFICGVESIYFYFVALHQIIIFHFKKASCNPSPSILIHEIRIVEYNVINSACVCGNQIFPYLFCLWSLYPAIWFHFYVVITHSIYMLYSITGDEV